jgi:hypothetical protein
MGQQSRSKSRFESPDITNRFPQKSISVDHTVEVRRRNNLGTATGKLSLRCPRWTPSPDEVVGQNCVENKSTKPDLIRGANLERRHSTLMYRSPTDVRHQQTRCDPSRMVESAVEVNCSNQCLNHVPGPGSHHPSKASCQHRLQMSIVNNPRCDLRPKPNAVTRQPNCEIGDRVSQVFKRAKQPMPRMRCAPKQLIVAEAVSDLSLHRTHRPSLAHRCR